MEVRLTWFPVAHTVPLSAFTCRPPTNPVLSHCDLARRFIASEETFSRRLASARRTGWAEMTIDARRRRIYCLSEEGRRVLDAATPNWERAQERLRQQLGNTEWIALINLTERVPHAALPAERAPRRNSPPGPSSILSNVA